MDACVCVLYVVRHTFLCILLLLSPRTNHWWHEQGLIAAGSRIYQVTHGEDHTYTYLEALSSFLFHIVCAPFILSVAVLKCKNTLVFQKLGELILHVFVAAVCLLARLPRPPLWCPPWFLVPATGLCHMPPDSNTDSSSTAWINRWLDTSLVWYVWACTCMWSVCRSFWNNQTKVCVECRRGSSWTTATDDFITVASLFLFTGVKP